MLIHASPPQLHRPPLLSPAIPTTFPSIPNYSVQTTSPVTPSWCRIPLRPETPRALHGLCSARRRVRYEEDEADEGYDHNAEIAMLESYSGSARSEALLVRAAVDDEEEVVLIFKGFSSCLSSGTAPDPSRGVLLARAVIRSIDVIKGPFDPSNIEYLEKGLTWEAFEPRLHSNRS